MVHSRVYLDTNVLIYLIEGHAEFLPRVAEMMLGTKKSGGTLILSELCKCECLIGPMKNGRDDLVEKYEAAFEELTDVEYMGFDSSALEQVPEIAALCGLKLVDAMHLSLALQAGCDGFVTNDRGFDRADDLIDLIRL